MRKRRRDGEGIRNEATAPVLRVDDGRRVSQRLLGELLASKEGREEGGFVVIFEDGERSDRLDLNDVVLQTGRGV